jgi:hypothetical protein
MAIPSRQIGWSTEDNLLWQISKQLERLTQVTGNSVSTTTTTTTLPVYQVFTASLTQSGGDNGDNTSSGTLTIGVTYTIQDNSGNPDFTIVGSPNNLEGTSFIATGTTPDWGNDAATLSFNTGAPVVTVLENTLGNVWFTYSDVGEYIANSNNLFTIDKTTSLIGDGITNLNFSVVKTISGYNTSNISISSYDISTNGSGQYDDILSHTTLEIKVYN